MVSCDVPNRNRRHQKEERPCGIYPYGVELPANHPVLLETFLHGLAEVEHCWFFNGRQSENHRSGPIDVCIYTGKGYKRCMLPFQSEIIPNYINTSFPGTGGNLLAWVAFPPY